MWELRCFKIRGLSIFVTRKDIQGVIGGMNLKTGDICVFTPPAVSYHQAALEAVAAFENSNFFQGGSKPMSIWDTIFYISSAVSLLGMAGVIVSTVLIYLEVHEEQNRRESEIDSIV